MKYKTWIYQLSQSSSEQIKELWVAHGLYREWWSYAIGGNMATWKTRIN